MKKFILSFLLIMFMAGALSAQSYPFTQLDTNFTTAYLLVPGGFQFSLLFQQNQNVLLGNGTSEHEVT
jgi:hypothetical protein